MRHKKHTPKKQKPLEGFNQVKQRTDLFDWLMAEIPSFCEKNGTQPLIDSLQQAMAPRATTLGEVGYLTDFITMQLDYLPVTQEIEVLQALTQTVKSDVTTSDHHWVSNTGRAFQ